MKTKDWSGPFEDVREVERRTRRERDDLIRDLKAAIALCDGILMLQNSQGFRHLTTTLEDMLKHRTAELLSAREDRTATVLQGRCLELRAILSVTTATAANREALAQQLAEAEDRYRELERSFKPQSGDTP